MTCRQAATERTSIASSHSCSVRRPSEHRDVDMRKPTLTPASWLIYAGGLTVLGAALGALGYLASQYGDGAFVLWALLVLVVLYGLALGYKRQDRWLASGIFAFSSIVRWPGF